MTDFCGDSSLSIAQKLQELARDLATGQASGRRSYTGGRFMLDFDGRLSTYDTASSLFNAATSSVDPQTSKIVSDAIVSKMTVLSTITSLATPPTGTGLNSTKLASNVDTIAPSLASRIKITIRITLDPPGVEIIITF